MITALINKKHNFDEVVSWIYETMPKDDNTNRWKFVDLVNTVEEHLLFDQQTYIIFEDERDYLMFTLRWS
jgi:hypothetical protein